MEGRIQDCGERWPGTNPDIDPSGGFASLRDFGDMLASLRLWIDGQSYWRPLGAPVTDDTPRDPVLWRVVSVPALVVDWLTGEPDNVGLLDEDLFLALEDRLRVTPVGLGTAAWKSKRNRAVAAVADYLRALKNPQVKDLCDRILGVGVVTDQSKPVWASMKGHVERDRTGTAGLAKRLGLGHYLVYGGWLTLLSYPLNRRQLFQPTVVDALGFPCHYPSNRRAGLGYAVDLRPGYSGGERQLVSELVHRAPPRWTSSHWAKVVWELEIDPISEQDLERCRMHHRELLTTFDYAPDFDCPLRP
jgi:hypothetical protein